MNGVHVVDVMWFQPKPKYQKVVAVVKFLIDETPCYFMGVSDRMEFNVVRLEEHDLEECYRIFRYGEHVSRKVGQMLFGED